MAALDPPIRTLFVNRFYHPDLSATSRMLTQLTEDMASHGQDISVITSRYSYLGGAEAWPDRDRHRGVTIQRVWSTHFGRRSSVGRLVDYLSFSISAFWAVLRHKRVDWLVVLADPPMLSVLGAVAKRLLRCRAACWLQDIFPQIAIQSGLLKRGLFSSWISRVARWSLESLDRVVVVGRCMEQTLLEEGFSGKNLVNIPNWADGAQLFPLDRRDSPFVSEHGLEQQFVLMYSGNLGVVHEMETVENVLRCTNLIARFTMCVIGDGAQMSRLKEVAQEEQWSHVRFLPYQPEETLRWSLTAAHVHLVTLKPGMNGLSVPSKIYGILAVGRPVIFIGPEASEAAAIIREARCGYVIAPGDHQSVVKALIAYRDDHSLLHTHGRRARAYFDAHCSRTIGTSRFVSLLRDCDDRSIGTPVAYPVPAKGQRPSTGKVAQW